MSQHSQWSSIVAALGLLAGLSGCSDDNGTDSNASPSTAPGAGNTPATPAPVAPGANGGSAPAATSKDPLVILTERPGPDGALHYLHVLPDWPATGKLDFKQSVELGEPGVASAQGDAFLFYHAKAGRIEKLGINDKLEVQRGAEISFVNYGIMGYDAEPIYASPERAYLVDEKSGQVARFNPAELKIDEVVKVDPAVLTRSGLPGQFQLGLAANGRLFTTVNWRDWKGKAVPATVIGVFDEQNPAGGPRLVEEPRCAPSVANGVFEDDQYVYAVSDAANAFDIFASPVRTTLPQCVVRMRKDGTAFEQDYLIDLQQVTKSPAIRMSWPMKDGKLLVNLWSPTIDPATTIKPGDDKTFWESKGWAYAVVDLATRTSINIAAIPPGPQRSNKLLKVDDQSYLQVFRADDSSLLYRVNPDATVTQVLDMPTGANVQYLGRLKPKSN